MTPSSSPPLPSNHHSTSSSPSEQQHHHQQNDHSNVVDVKGSSSSSLPTVAPFGQVQYSEAERNFLQRTLEEKLTNEYIATRAGPGGGQVHYIETWRAIELANHTFGFNGWSSSIVEITADYFDESQGKYSCGMSAVVRVTLKDGSFHEDIGYGNSENQRQKSAAFEQAKKKAVSDGLKRALRNFGNALGLTVYDRDHLKSMKRQAAVKRAIGLGGRGAAVGASTAASTAVSAAAAAAGPNGVASQQSSLASRPVNPHFSQTQTANSSQQQHHQEQPVVSSPPQQEKSLQGVNSIANRRLPQQSLSNNPPQQQQQQQQFNNSRPPIGPMGGGGGGGGQLNRISPSSNMNNGSGNTIIQPFVGTKRALNQMQSSSPVVNNSFGVQKQQHPHIPSNGGTMPSSGGTSGQSFVKKQKTSL